MISYKGYTPTPFLSCGTPQIQTDESSGSSLDSSMGDVVTANRNDSRLNYDAAGAAFVAADGVKSAVGGRGGGAVLPVTRTVLSRITRLRWCRSTERI